MSISFKFHNDLDIVRYCLEGVWRVSGGCLENVWRVSGKCLEGVGRVSGGYLESVRKKQE